VVSRCVPDDARTLLWNLAGHEETPYDYFDEHLDRASFVPSGHDAAPTGDWAHFADAQATRLLGGFRATIDIRTQTPGRRANRTYLARQAAFVPLYAAPFWSTYSTRYFVGFPSAANDYIQPEFNNSDYVVALTRIRPRG
jgi:peptide/nickel transport system substrate-binding protein